MMVGNGGDLYLSNICGGTKEVLGATLSTGWPVIVVERLVCGVVLAHDVNAMPSTSDLINLVVMMMLV